MNRILTSLILILAFAAADMAHAETRYVGPTNFHHQIQVPNAIGTNHRNNEDSVFQSDSRKQKRSERARKHREEQQAANEESRTASDTVDTKHKRKGRWDHNQTATQQRLQQRAAEKALNDGGLSDLVND